MESKWSKNYIRISSFLNKLTGAGGVLYPPKCFYKDILNDSLFMTLAPTNDDIWFWIQGVLKGIRVRVTDNPEYILHYVRNTQSVGLSKINGGEAGLFWKDFNRVIMHYPQLKQTLITEYKI